MFTKLAIAAASTFGRTTLVMPITGGGEIVLASEQSFVSGLLGVASDD